MIRCCTDPLRLPARRDWRDAMIVCAVAMAWAFALAWSRGRIVHPEMYEHEIIAEHLALGHGFRTPLDRSADAPPTTYEAPLWPILASLVYRTLGVNTPAARYVLVLLNAGFFGVMCGAVYLLASLLFFRLAAVLSILLILAHKPLLDQVPIPWSRAMALAIFAVLLASVPLVRRSGASIAKLALLGAGLGILSLTNASFVLAYPVLVLKAAGATSWMRRIILCAVALLTFVVVLLPWTIRNYIAFDRLSYVRDTLGLELWHGNLPFSTGTQDRLTYPLHPFQNARERELMLSLGEPQYMKLCTQRFGENYRHNPGAFWRRTFNRAMYLVYGDTTTRAGGGRFERFRWNHHYLDRIAFNSFYAILGVAGIWTMWRLRYEGLWLIGAGLLAVAPYLITHAADRYALPLRLVLIVSAGFLVAAVIVRLTRGSFPGVAAGTARSTP